MPFDISPETSPEDLPKLVNGSEFAGHSEFPTVVVDDRQGGMDATKHLIELGHRQIAAITGDIESTSAQLRLEGFRKAMADAGIPVNERMVINGEYSIDSGEFAVKELLIRRDRPTAIFCFSDEIALGCMHALRTSGFQIPRDISVIGFDDIPFAKYFVPSLTTIAQPAEAIGRMCATLLLDLIDGKSTKKKRFILPHTLVVRESTGRIA